MGRFAKAKKTKSLWKPQAIQVALNTKRKVMYTICRRLLMLGVLSLSLGHAAVAQQTAPQDNSPADARQAELRTAYQAAVAALKKGPVDVPIAGQATLKVPEGHGFIPAAEARQLLRAWGNHPDDQDQGMIVPVADKKADWFVVVSYMNAGYIKDDDARDWKADELLSSIREGTEETNKERKARGIPEMEIIGWVEKPLYDAATRRLVWSLSSRDKGAPAGDVPGINYNTLALGREGYISMNLVTDLNAVEALKPTAKLFLSGLEFDQGKRYGDFNASTDKVAEYGLAALVAGVAAKKLGLLAVIAAFFVKFAKIIGVAVVAALGGFAKWRRKKPDA